MTSGAQDFDCWALLLKGLAHPVRLHVLRLLLEGPKCVTRVNDLVAVSQPNLSQHLNALRRAGLVACHSHGPKRCYYLTRPAFVRALFRILNGVEAPEERSREAVLSELARQGCPVHPESRREIRSQLARDRRG